MEGARVHHRRPDIVAEAGRLSQRCSAGLTFSSQSRQRSDSVFCEVQPSAEPWAVPALEPDYISRFCLVESVLFDLVYFSCV